MGVNPSAELSSRVGNILSMELSPKWRNPSSKYEWNLAEENITVHPPVSLNEESL